MVSKPCLVHCLFNEGLLGIQPGSTFGSSELELVASCCNYDCVVMDKALQRHSEEEMIDQEYHLSPFLNIHF